MRLGDLWRGELSLRELAVYVDYLPVGSATWAAQAELPYGWTLTDVLIADVFQALTGEPHPLRPHSGREAQEQRRAEVFARLHDQRARLSNPPTNEEGAEP